jgi:hypothetical protein
VLRQPILGGFSPPVAQMGQKGPLGCSTL